MEIFSKDIQMGVIKIELTVQESEGCTVIFTAKDDMDGVIWRVPLKDSDGKIKVYPTAADAFLDAERKLRIYNN